jgi:hypothetical protein
VHTLVAGAFAACALAQPLRLHAQSDARRALRAVVDSTCLTGRACRLELVDLNDGRRGRAPEFVLMRGVGGERYVVGRAWDRVAFAVGADAEAFALANDARLAHGRARRREAIGIAGTLGLSLTAAVVVAGPMLDRDPTFGFLTIMYGTVVALPVTLVSGIVLGLWADVPRREADALLEDAIHAWNRRVDPRVP